VTTQHAAASTQHSPLPELGPSLGRLTAIPGATAGVAGGPRDEFADLRLAFVGRLFDLAALARRAPDAEAAAAIVTPDRLRIEWERAAGQVADRVVERIGAALSLAGRRSGVPLRRLRREMMTPGEVAFLRARLLGAGVPFLDGLTALDVEEAGTAEWGEALLASMRRLEQCWLTLERRADDEAAAWHDEAERLAAWRPSPWPRRVIAILSFAILMYAGFVLGGFLPVPAFARPVAEWWWHNEP
jgi:hypothetical protein